jgi:hypothetical protein
MKRFKTWSNGPIARAKEHSRSPEVITVVNLKFLQGYETLQISETLNVLSLTREAGGRDAM